MSEVDKIILTSSLTVLSGVLLLVIGQVVEKFFIEPINEQSKLLGETSFALTFYANLYSNPGMGKTDDMDEASKSLRQLASRLRATTRSIRWYGLWHFLRITPKQQDVLVISTELIGLSNGVYQGNPFVNLDRREKIKKALGIKYDI